MKRFGRARCLAESRLGEWSAVKQRRTDHELGETSREERQRK